MRRVAASPDVYANCVRARQILHTVAATEVGT